MSTMIAKRKVKPYLKKQVTHFWFFNLVLIFAQQSSKVFQHFGVDFLLVIGSYSWATGRHNYVSQAGLEFHL